MQIEGTNSEAFEVERGLRQGDQLSPILFNVILEKVLTDNGIHSKGVIYHHGHQAVTYTDDLTIMTRLKVDCRMC